MKTSIALLSCALVLSLAACQKATEQAAAPVAEKPGAAATPAPAPTAPTAAPAAASAEDTRARLRRFHWRLTEANDGGGQKLAALFTDGEPIQLDFGPNDVSIDHLCNRMSGDYRLRGDQLEFGSLASTRMACADPARTAQEQGASTLFSGGFDLAFEGDAATPVMVLKRANGTTLRFAGEETAESRYGAGQTEFLEVAAQTKPCPHPLIKDKQCLQVREVRFDDHGLRQGEPGPWQNFQEDIQGYTHQAGMRNVLRVKRYTRPNPPADASANLYVLDLVVESEQVH